MSIFVKRVNYAAKMCFVALDLGVEVTEPKPSLESLKLNFDMTKQVMSTTATIVTLLVIYLKASGTTPSSSAPGSVVRISAVLLLVSLIMGVACMGRHIGNVETGDFASQEKLTKWLGIGQQLTFVLGMAGVLVLVFVAG